MTEPLTYTVEQAAERLGVSRGTAYQAVREGQVPSVRVGRRVLIPRHRLEAFLNGEQLNGARTDSS